MYLLLQDSAAAMSDGWHCWCIWKIWCFLLLHVWNMSFFFTQGEKGGGGGLFRPVTCLFSCCSVLNFFWYLFLDIILNTSILFSVWNFDIFYTQTVHVCVKCTLKLVHSVLVVYNYGNLHRKRIASCTLLFLFFFLAFTEKGDICQYHVQIRMCWLQCNHWFEDEEEKGLH